MKPIAFQHDHRCRRCASAFAALEVTLLVCGPNGYEMVHPCCVGEFDRTLCPIIEARDVDSCDVAHEVVLPLA